MVPINALKLLIALLFVWTTGLHADFKESAESALLSDTRQLTFEGKRAGEGYFNAQGNRMIFQSERDPANPFYQIYLMDLETGDVEQVSPGIGKTTCGWIHPSDERVLYASTHDDPAAQQKMQSELDFRASGQKRRYAWDYDATFDIYAQDLETGQRRNLTGTMGYDAEAAYSPDGSRIVFASNRRAYDGKMNAAEAEIFQHDKSYMMDLYLMAADGTDVRRLTNAPGYDGGPFFSSDGRKITWRRFSEDGARAEIFVMDLEKGVEQQITRTGVMSWAPFFHPSGDYLIFASNQEGFANFELFIVDAEGRREPVRVTYTDGFDGLPVFSPDGSKLAWTSKRATDKTSQIFLGRWDHDAARRLLGLGQSKNSVVTDENAATMSIAATASEIRAEDARLHVSRLAAEEMEGRLTGSEGERRATDYVASVFRQLGLQPGGDQGDYFQSFPFTAGVKLGPASSLEMTGIQRGDGLALDRDWRPLAISRNGAVAAAGVVFAGYGIVAPGLDKIPDYDAYGDLDVSGKWVMVFRFQPESITPAWRRHLIHYSDLAYKAAVAKRRGALGLIVVSGPNAQARDRLVELKLDAAASNSAIAGISVSDDLAAQMVRRAGKDLKRLQDSLDKGEPGEAFAIPALQLSATLDIEKRQSLGRNVIGVLPAQRKSTEPVVILGAHVDHLGRGQASGSLAVSTERGKIHYGADDNASGVAAMLEAAQYLTGLNRQGKLAAERDIWFVAWSGEELGTLGSSHFVERMAKTGEFKEQVAAYLNMDMVGHLGEKAYLQGTGSSSLWSREIERRNVPVGLPIATKEDPYLPTDSTPFYMKGVPVLNAFTGAHEDYSTPRDKADNLNYQGIRDIARLMAGITRSLARRSEAPDYIQVARKKGGISRKHLRAYLGTIPAYGQDESSKGVRLQGAVKDGPAEKAGVRQDDLLVALAGVEIESIHDFMSALAGLKPGEKTDMTVLREGKRVRLQVVPAARE